MEHPDIIQCVRYVSGDCPDDLIFEIDGHIARCEECLDRIRALLFLKNNLNIFFDSRAGEEYGKACRSLKYIQRLMKLSDSEANAAGRITTLCGNIVNEAGIAVRALMNHSKKIVSLCADRMRDDLDYRALPAFSGVGTPESAALEEKITEGSLKLLNGDPSEAEKVLGEVSIKNGRCVQSGTIEVFDGSERIARVAADSRKRSAQVMYWVKRGEPFPEFACLIPDAGGDPVFTEFLPVEGAEYMLAEFRNIPDGTYGILM